MRIDNTASIPFTAEGSAITSAACEGNGGSFASILSQLEAGGTTATPSLSVARDPSVPVGSGTTLHSAGAPHQEASAEPVCAHSDGLPSDLEPDVDEAPVAEGSDPSALVALRESDSGCLAAPVAILIPHANATETGAGLADCALLPAGIPTSSTGFDSRLRLPAEGVAVPGGTHVPAQDPLNSGHQSGAEAGIRQARCSGIDYSAEPGNADAGAHSDVGEGIPLIVRADELVDRGPVPDQTVPRRAAEIAIDVSDRAIPASEGSTRVGDTEGAVAGMSDSGAASPDVPNERAAAGAAIALFRFPEGEGGKVGGIEPVIFTGSPAFDTQLGSIRETVTAGTPVAEQQLWPASQSPQSEVSMQPAAGKNAVSREAYAPRQNLRAGEPQPGSEEALLQARSFGMAYSAGPDGAEAETHSELGRWVPADAAADGPAGPGPACDQPVPRRALGTGNDADPRAIPPSGSAARGGGNDLMAARISEGGEASPDLPRDGPAREAGIPLFRLPEGDGGRAVIIGSKVFAGSLAVDFKPGLIRQTETAGAPAAEPETWPASRSAQSQVLMQRPSEGGGVSIGTYLSGKGSLAARPQSSDHDGTVERILRDIPTGHPSTPSPQAHKSGETPIPMLSQAGDPSAGQAEFLLRVAERIRILANGSTHAMTVQLKPDHLGRISLEARGGADGLVARITTESAGLKQFLESNLPALQQSLQEQGLRVHHIDIVIQEGGGSQNHGGTWQDRTGQYDSGQTSESSPADGQAPPIACEITLDPWMLAALHPHSTFHTIA